jgi:hypothetical protein
MVPRAQPTPAGSLTGRLRSTTAGPVADYRADNLSSGAASAGQCGSGGDEYPREHEGRADQRPRRQTPPRHLQVAPAFGPSVVAAVGSSALLFVRRGHADTALEARPAPRIHLPRALTAKSGRALVLASCESGIDHEDVFAAGVKFVSFLQPAAAGRPPAPRRAAMSRWTTTKRLDLSVGLLHRPGDPQLSAARRRRRVGRGTARRGEATAATPA